MTNESFDSLRRREKMHYNRSDRTHQGEVAAVFRRRSDRKMKRRYAILTAVLVIALMLSGCSPGSGHNTGSHGSGGGRAEAAGDYYAFVCTAQDGTDCSAKDITLSLNADGTGEFRFPGGSLELRWSVRGTELSFTDEDGVNFSGNCTSGLISGDYRGYEFIFTNDKEYAQSYVSFDDGAPSPVIG